MKGNLFETNRSLSYFALMIVVFITFYPFFQTGFGCADDLQNYLIFKSGNTWENMNWLARFAGRFYYLIVHPVYMVPYMTGSMFVTKLFHHLPLIAGVILFAVTLFRMDHSRELSLFYLLIFFTIAQASKHTSLFVNYPFFFTFSFDLLLISFLFLLSYFDSSRKYWLVLSVILFAVAILFSEIYLVYLLIFVIIIVAKVTGTESGTGFILKRTGILVLPFLGVTVAYVAAYFIFRVYHPSQYPGTMIDTQNVDVPGFFNALWNLTQASYPLTMFEENRHLLNMKSELIGGHSPVIMNIILNARIEWIIKGICVAVAGFILLTGIHRISYKTLLAGTGLAVLLIFIPQIPLAISVKYISHVEGGMKGYIPTFFSMFGTVLLISLMAGYLVNLLQFNRYLKTGTIIILASVLFVISVLTDLNNYTVAMDAKRANRRFQAMDELMKTPYFKQIPAQSTLFTEGLYKTTSQQFRGLTEQGFNWDKYITVQNGIIYNVFRDFKDIPVPPPGKEDPVYSFDVRQAEKGDEVLLVLARLPQKKATGDYPAPFVDEVGLLYYSAYKEFSVSFNTGAGCYSDSISMYVNTTYVVVRPESNVELTIYSTQITKPATFFTIRAPGIDLNSIRVSHMINKKYPVITIWPDPSD